MHSTQNEKRLDVSMSFLAPACGTSPHPFMSELLCICQRQRKLQEFCVLCGYRKKLTFRGDDRFHTEWRRSRARDEMGPGVVSGGARLRPGFPAVHRGGISVFDYVEVMSSSPGRFICSGYIRADVIRAQCSGRSSVAPGVLRSIFTLFFWKIHPKICLLGSD